MCEADLTNLHMQFFTLLNQLAHEPPCAGSSHRPLDKECLFFSNQPKTWSFKTSQLVLPPLS